ncbi:4-aminobutyrate--2-oxoglutarate transaminase [Clostridium oryzae]|uniref:(S)-3-amino-2-methylpropionate transaminase n=1 Tax=Clostridium oryzae TaxID=1450648 RepID=A0A1V4IXF2_9CLOT|nr:4-aminobutyrate--2-oxoglutarate transaminase [Clostridium oryzae]OPJ64573.1 4-aminobutyrate aminotransferase PuuE [Clostridium oryzae]
MIKENNAKIITDSLPGPKSQVLLQKRNRYVARGVSYSTEIFAEEAKDALIKDIDGNVFVDFAAGIGVINSGHCDNDVVKAIKKQAEKYIHTSFNVCMYEPYVILAERLSNLIPGDSPKKVMFANSGAEAVENAVKIARKYTGKSGVLSLESSFHGRTYMTMTLTSKVKPYKDGFAPFNSDTYKIPNAYCYRCPLGCKYPSCGLACAESFRTMLKSNLSPDMIAVLIAEPVQGEGGFIVPPKEYLQVLQSICNENGIVFVVDEIQTGFSRTGKLFAHEHFDIEPDLVTVSKSIAAGLPLSGVIGKAEIMDTPIPGSLGGTYGGNPVACAAALKVLDKIHDQDLNSKAEHIGSKILNKLNSLKDRYDFVGDVRGLGAMVAIELVKDKSTKEPDKEKVSRIIDYCYRKGVILLNAGIYGNVIRFLPPLVMTDDQLEYGLDILETAFAEA